MIKTPKKIKLHKNFKLQITNAIILPGLIKEKDIYSMFAGLMSIIKSQAKQEAKTQECHNAYAYSHLLNMYKRAVSEMNKYKALYLKSQNILNLA